MPAYTVAATAVTLRMPLKWVDNVLSHHSIPGVKRGRQGLSRRLAPQSILSLEIALRISRALRIPMAQALELSSRLLSGAAADVGHGITLSIDLESIRDDLHERMAHAVEIAPSPRRGRPPGA